MDLNIESIKITNMKFIIKLLSICSLFIILYSCHSRTSSDEVETIQFSNLKNIESIIFGDSNYLDSSFLVKLETNTESLLGNIAQIEVYDNSIFIYDKAVQKILVFDLQGKFKGSISKKGRAPEEYSSLCGFYINPYDSTINLFDPLMLTVQKYTLDGNYLNKIKHTNKNLCYFSKATMINENQIFCYHKSNKHDNLLYSIIDIKDYNLTNGIESYPYLSDQNVSYTLSNNPYIFRNGKVVYTKLFSNVLYSNGDEVSLPYFFINDKEEIDKDYLLKRLKEVDGDYYKVRQDIIKENKYNTGFLNIFENDRFLLADIATGNGSVNGILWDKKNKSGVNITQYSTYKPDLMLFKAISGNSVISIWDRSAISAFKRNAEDNAIYPKDVREMAENFNDEDDNPILIFHTFKNE